jgi:hypothetical protein
MSTAEWDLDTLSDDQPAGPGHALALVLTLAIALGGLAGGAVVGSALASADPPRHPPAATLAIRDLYVDASSPAPNADREATGTAEPSTGLRSGRPVVVLRLQIDNPGPVPLALSSLQLDGVAPGGTVLPLSTRVAGHRSGVVDVSVSPECSGDTPSTTVRARLRLAGSPETTEIPVPTSRELGQTGGLCTVLENELPRGWQAPIETAQTRRRGRDLEVTVPDLSGDQVAGILVDDRLLPTVLVGDRLLSASAQLRPGQPTVLRFRGPPPCVENSSTVTIPSAIRLLARDSGGLRQQMIIIGPELTRWLRLACS